MINKIFVGFHCNDRIGIWIVGYAAFVAPTVNCGFVSSFIVVMQLQIVVYIPYLLNII